MSFLTNLWNKFLAKLGSVAAFIPGIAESVKIAIESGDVEKVRAHATQLKELAAAIDFLADAALDATDDGSITLVEGSELALAIESVIDEADDVIKGYDT